MRGHVSIRAFTSAIHCACVLPFMFAFVERIIARGKWSDVAGLGISYGLLVLCNLPMVVLGSLAAGVYALIRLMQSFGKRSVYQLAGGILSGLVLSCFYWLPMLFEMKWKSPSGAGQGAWPEVRGGGCRDHGADGGPGRHRRGNAPAQDAGRPGALAAPRLLGFLARCR